MLRSRGQIGFLITIVSCLLVNQSVLSAPVKRMARQPYARVVSLSQDMGGNFVLLNTLGSDRLPFPQIHYLPAVNGQAQMAADFPGTILSAQSTTFSFPESPVRQLHVGQLQTSPPVLRLSFLAANMHAFEAVDFRSSSGSLVIKVPSSAGQSTAYLYDRQPAINEPQKLPPLAPPRSLSVTAQAPPLAPPQLNQIASDDANTPQLRGPILLPQAEDASYTKLAGSSKREPNIESKPAPKLAPKILPTSKTLPTPAQQVSDINKQSQDTQASKQPYSLKQTLKRVLGMKDSNSNESSDEMPPKAPPANKAKPQIALENGAPLNVSFSGQDPLQVQIKLGTQQPVTYKTFRLHQPERYVVDIEGLKSGEQQISAPANLYVKGVRVGTPEGVQNVSRLVLDLEGAGAAVIAKIDADQQGITLTVEPETAAKKDSLAGKGAGTSERSPANCLVVLDAGHGGSDPGAQRGDIQEKELTLAIVDKLRKDLEAQGVRVKLTRWDDTFVSLEDRVKVTNAVQPDAFVSVHINSLETDAATSGIETYYQNESSKDLAQLIHASLVKQLAVPDRAVRKARFYVINHTPVPAILAEVGFISNKDERSKLISSDYQAQIAEALAGGVMLYLAQKGQAPGVEGTQSSMAPSAGGQSFTQNLHWQAPASKGVRMPESLTQKPIRDKRTADLHAGTPLTKVAGQSLKFK